MELRKHIKHCLFNELKTSNAEEILSSKKVKRQHYIKKTVSEYSEAITDIAISNDSPYLRWYFEKMIKELLSDLKIKNPVAFGTEELFL